MIVNQQGLATFSFSLREYDRGSVCGHDLRFEAALLKHRFYNLRAFLQSDILRADAWLCHIMFQFLEASIEICFEI